MSSTVDIQLKWTRRGQKMFSPMNDKKCQLHNFVRHIDTKWNWLNQRRSERERSSGTSNDKMILYSFLLKAKAQFEGKWLRGKSFIISAWVNCCKRRIASSFSRAKNRIFCFAFVSHFNVFFFMIAIFIEKRRRTIDWRRARRKRRFRFWRPRAAQQPTSTTRRDKDKQKTAKKEEKNRILIRKRFATMECV